VPRPTGPASETSADRRGGRDPGPQVTASGACAGGTITGQPRRLLRLEAAVLLAGSLIAYSATRQHWWLVPLTILLPDLLMVGYLAGTRLGARLYNLAHSTPLPAAVVGLACWQGKPLLLALGLVWLAHIGADRLMGYGLKYDDHFQHTHLGQPRGHK
jgi:hypothetical protein